MSNRRVWMVTGASRGLGLSLALAVARTGDALIICGRGRTALEGAAREIEAQGGEVLAGAGDVRDSEFAARLVRRGRSRFGRIDVLVNNASQLGPSPLPPVLQFPPEALLQVYETNVAAPMRLTQLVVPEMIAHGSGLVINVSSDAAQGGYPGWSGYGASKAALDLITHTLDQELQGTGVRAISVDPGDMRTQMHQEAFPSEDISDRPAPEVAVPALLWLGTRGPEPGVWRYQAQRWRTRGGDVS